MTLAHCKGTFFDQCGLWFAAALLATAVVAASCGGSASPEETRGDDRERAEASQHSAQEQVDALSSVLERLAHQQDRGTSVEDFLAALGSIQADLREAGTPGSAAELASVIESLTVPSSVPPKSALVSEFPLSKQGILLIPEGSLSRLLKSALDLKADGDISGVEAVLKWCDNYLSLFLRAVRSELAGDWMEGLIGEIAKGFPLTEVESILVSPGAVTTSDVADSLLLDLMWWCEEVEQMFLSPSSLEYVFTHHPDDDPGAQQTRVATLKQSAASIESSARHWGEIVSKRGSLSATHESWVHLLQAAEDAVTNYPAPYLFEKASVRKLRVGLWTYCILRALLLDDASNQEHEFEVRFSGGDDNEAIVLSRFNDSPEALITIPWPPK